MRLYLVCIYLVGRKTSGHDHSYKLTAIFMNDTNFLRTAIISEKFFEGISLRIASTESWIGEEGPDKGWRKRWRDGGRERGRDGIKKWSKGKGESGIITSTAK